MHIRSLWCYVLSFSAQIEAECGFLVNCFHFFSCICMHQNVSGRPRSFCLILYICMFHHVYIRTMSVDHENINHMWSYVKSNFLYENPEFLAAIIYRRS